MRKIAVLVMAGMVLAAGCKKNEVDKGAFKSALNNYLSAQKQCLFTAPMKFPQQADTKDDEDTKQFDALTDGVSEWPGPLACLAGRSACGYPWHNRRRSA